MKSNNIGRFNSTPIETEEDLSLAQQVMKFNLILMQKFNGKPETAEELAERFTDYFEMCMEYGRTPTVEGLALVSGYERKSFYEISQGVFSTQFTPIVKKAKDYIASYDAEMANQGKVPSPVYIFRSKNYYGMKDVQEVKVEANANSQVPENVDEIIDKLPEREETLAIGDGK